MSVTEMGLIEAKETAATILERLTTTSPHLPALTAGERKSLTNMLVDVNERISTLEPSDSYVVGQREQISPDEMLQQLGEHDPETSQRIRDAQADTKAQEALEQAQMDRMNAAMTRQAESTRLGAGMPTWDDIQMLRNELEGIPVGPMRDALQRRIQLDSDRLSDAEQAARIEPSAD